MGTYLKFFKNISLVSLELDLHCCVMVLSSYEELGFLIAGASLVAEHGLYVNGL